MEITATLFVIAEKTSRSDKLEIMTLRMSEVSRQCLAHVRTRTRHRRRIVLGRWHISSTTCINTSKHLVQKNHSRLKTVFPHSRTECDNSTLLIRQKSESYTNISHFSHDKTCQEMQKENLRSLQSEKLCTK